MSIGILESDLPTSTTSVSEDPQFDLAIRPWQLVGIAAMMALLLVAFFVYGQATPGA